MSVRTIPLSTTPQLGALLIGARKAKGLTQAQLSTRMGLSQRRLSELERMPGTLSVDQLLTLCQQLGLQLQVAAMPHQEGDRVEKVNPLASNSSLHADSKPPSDEALGPDFDKTRHQDEPW